jgi:cation-transporting ATPase E
VVGVEELVTGDLVQLQAGDQVVADGRLEEASALTVDESILTGEAEPVGRRTGDEVRSGSFAVEGSGAFTVTAVGSESYAERIAGEARAFRHPRSPLERSLDRLLFVLVAVLVPLAVILGAALWERDTPLDEAVTTAVAAGVTLVPEGLILLTSLTFAVAALQMTRRGALAQQLNAIESLA